MGQATLSFLGANGTVTGSRYLVETANRRVLVDCGMFQGYKPLRLRNWAPPPFEPASLDAVVLTHAHLDHSGMLPRLVRQGFRGPVYASAATVQLCGILLTDAGRLQEDDAADANRHGWSKHQPALPLYTEEDARVALRAFRALEFGKRYEVAPGVVVQLQRAGHLLGAASVAMDAGGASVLFSGDLGRPDDPIMRPPEPIGRTERLVVESTYGDRAHARAAPGDELAPILARVAARGGVAVVPTFAVGRAQALMLEIARLRAAGRIPAIPVYLDSPMAIDATQLYLAHRGEHRLDEADCALLRDAAVLVRTSDESRALNRRRGPMVILSASGMATGGRVLHHLRERAGDERNAIVLAGYQAGGTRGAALAAGARVLRIHGEDVAVRAEVHQLSALSAHADADELLAWIRTAKQAPREVFVTHGELAAADALRARIERELRLPARIPEYRDRVPLD